MRLKETMESKMILTKLRKKENKLIKIFKLFLNCKMCNVDVPLRVYKLRQKLKQNVRSSPRGAVHTSQITWFPFSVYTVI